MSPEARLEMEDVFFLYHLSKNYIVFLKRSIVFKTLEDVLVIVRMLEVF